MDAPREMSCVNTAPHHASALPSTPRRWRRLQDLFLPGHMLDLAFHACQVRYVRVNIFYHSLNRGVHLVEVKVFETE